MSNDLLPRNRIRSTPGGFLADKPTFVSSLSAIFSTIQVLFGSTLVTRTAKEVQALAASSRGLDLAVHSMHQGD